MPDFNESYLIFFPLFIYFYFKQKFVFLIRSCLYYANWQHVYRSIWSLWFLEGEIDFGRRENNVHHHREYYIQLKGNEQTSDTLPVWQNLHDPLTWITYRANPSDPFWRR